MVLLGWGCGGPKVSLSPWVLCGLYSHSSMSKQRQLGRPSVKSHLCPKSQTQFLSLGYSWYEVANSSLYDKRTWTALVFPSISTKCFVTPSFQELLPLSVRDLRAKVPPELNRRKGSDRLLLLTCLIMFYCKGFALVRPTPIY